MRTPGLRSQSGQMITEAILILVLLFGVTLLTARYFKDKEVFRTLISGPWVALAGMLQNGVWAPPNVGAAIHPNAHNRHIAIVGEPAQ